MDDGYVIPGLNEGYTLFGAKIMEWVSGVVVAMIIQELLNLNLSRSAPLMLAIAFFAVMGLKSARKTFPDEEQGLRNYVMVNCGFVPPKIPTPAQFCPYWSGAPVREFPKTSYYEQLNLEAALVATQEDEAGSIFLKDGKV